MYSGELIDDLIEMVARVESRASHELAALPEPAVHPEVYAPGFLFDASQQTVLIGVA